MVFLSQPVVGRDVATGRQTIFDQDQTETQIMTDPKIPVTEDELHSYVDNELPAGRRGDVEACFAAHPDDAERVQSWRAMAEALHARYDSVADEAVPKRLEIERLERQAPQSWPAGACSASRANGSTVRLPRRCWRSSAAAASAGWRAARRPRRRRSRN